VVPANPGVAVLRPLPFQLHGGFWAHRQRVNTRTSIPHGMRQLHEYGQWDNLRRAAARRRLAQPADGEHAGRPYADSDVYKMAEALAWDAQRTGRDADADLTAVAALVGAAQEESGYVNSAFQRSGAPHFSDLPMGHEMYCAGHLIQAAVAAVRGPGHTALLGPARAFADHLVEKFGTPGQGAVCGHPQIEMSMVELYRLTGHRPYLDLAAQMVDLRGHGRLGPGHYDSAYYQDDTPIRAATELDGHCVRALYLAAGATDVYLETGEAALLVALTRLWEHTVASKTYLTGGVGCRRRTEAFGAPYELPPDQAFNESCAAVANVLWSWRLLLATGDGRYADHIERILFNVVAAAVSVTGDRFSYVNTLHRRGTAMEHGDKAPYRKDWFGCACCPPNVMRLLASLGHYLSGTDADGGIWLHQYATGTVRTGALELAVRTDYPWSGTVGITVSAAEPGEHTVALRLPGWCAGGQVRINGAAVTSAPSRGYVTLRRPWSPGDRVDLDLPMPPRLTWPDPRIDAVRGCVAVERGPLVYCFEDVDQPDGLPVDDARLHADASVREVSRPDLLGGIVTLHVPGLRTRRGRPAWPYGARDTADADSTPVTLTAIPYFAWDNRGLGAMRIWLPAVNAAAPAPA
jgi:DUF1680 family protein